MPRPAVQLSVIVPAIDEAETLPALLDDLYGQRDILLEVIVADGGSQDATAAIAERAGARVVKSDAGRARQMNAGAAVAIGRWLAFLHADSRLSAPDQLARALATLAACDGGARVAGHFALRFDAGDVAPGFYRFLEAKSATGRRHTINGDQGMVLRADFFAARGGFDIRQAFLEDQRFARAVRRYGRWRLCPEPIVTSARRFTQEGRRRRYLLMGLIMAMHLAAIEGFFERARQVYARQGEARRLALGPYVGVLLDLARHCGAAASTAAAWRIAGLIVAETWQPCLAIDVAIDRRRSRAGDGHRARYRLTRLHDAGLHHLFDNIAIRIAVCLGLLLMFVTASVWYICTHFSQGMTDDR